MIGEQNSTCGKAKARPSRQNADSNTLPHILLLNGLWIFRATNSQDELEKRSSLEPSKQDVDSNNSPHILHLYGLKLSLQSFKLLG